VRLQQQRSNTDGNSSSDGNAYRNTNSYVSPGHVDGGSDVNRNCRRYGDPDAYQNRVAHGDQHHRTDTDEHSVAHSNQHHGADTDQHSAAHSNRDAQRDRDVNADSERYAH